MIDKPIPPIAIHGSKSDQVHPPELTHTDEQRAGRALLWKGVQIGGSKILYLAGTLLLSHLLAPRDFGLVAIASVTIVTVMTATETGMTIALVQASVRERAHYDVAWTIGVVRGLLVYVVLLISAPMIAAMFADQEATPLIRLMAVVPLLKSLGSPGVADLMRDLRFSRLAAISLASVISELAVALALAHSLGGEAIIVGKIVGAATLCLATYLAAPYRPVLRFNYSASHDLIAFGRWIFAIGLTAVTGDLFMRVIISRKLGVSQLGLLSLGERLAVVPNELATEAIGAVALPLYARLRVGTTRTVAAFRAHLIGLMFVLLPATALILGLATSLERNVLGPDWTGTAPVIMLLAAGFAVELSFSAVSPLLQGLGVGRELFLVEALQYVVLIACVALLSGPLGVIGAGVARIAAAATVQFAGLRAVRWALGPFTLQLVRPSVVLLSLATLAGLLSFLCAIVIPGTTGLICGAVFGAAVFLVLTGIVDRWVRAGIREGLSLFFPILSARSH